MLYNRTPTKLYVLYLVPHKNQLTIEKIKKCSTTIHRSNPLISSLIVRQFRTKVEQAASSGLGRHSAFGKLSGQDDKQEKRFSFFKFFNPNYLDDHRLKNIAGSSKSIDEEKNRIKVSQVAKCFELKLTNNDFNHSFAVDCICRRISCGHR